MNLFNKRLQGYLLYGRQGLWLSSIACLVVFAFLLQVSSGSVAHAAQIKTNRVVTNPQVIIARDETPASCITTKIVSDPKTHKQLSMTKKHCDPGTQMGTQTVSLSYAKAHEEASILPLSANASSSEKRQWDEQVIQLMAKKQKALEQPLVVHPNASCSDGGLSVKVYTSYRTVLKDVVAGDVFYNVARDCSNIFIDSSILNVSIVPINNPIWWIGWRYASMSPQDCGSFPVYELVPNGSHTWHPDQTQPIGYYGVWDLDTQDICYFNDGGIIKSFNSGQPLN